MLVEFAINILASAVLILSGYVGGLTENGYRGREEIWRNTISTRSELTKRITFFSMKRNSSRPCIIC